MGPRPDGRGQSISTATFGSGHALQWGRDLTVADRNENITYIGDNALASMGPRPDGRGQPPCPRWASYSRDWLQWGRDLTVADRRWKISQRSSDGGSFNGAAT